MKGLRPLKHPRSVFGLLNSLDLDALYLVWTLLEVIFKN